MSSLFEIIRQCHSDIETHQKLLLEEMALEPKTFKEQIQRDAKVSSRLKLMSDLATRLIDHYEDADGIRKAELNAIGYSTAIEEYLRRFRALREFYDKNVNKKLSSSSVEEIKNTTIFSTLENGGRMVDLNSFYDRFCNLNIYKKIKEKEKRYQELETEREKEIKEKEMQEKEKAKEAVVATAMDAPIITNNNTEVKTDIINNPNTTNNNNNNKSNIFTSTTMDIPSINYLTYLAIFDDMYKVFSQKTKVSATPHAIREYSEYLADLISYLSTFFHRVQPLVSTDSLLEIMQKNFQQAWESKNIEGWFQGAVYERPDKDIPGRSNAIPALFLRDHDKDIATPGSNSTTDTITTKTIELGDDALKTNPLFCVACDKLFAKQPMFDQHLSGKKHLRAVKAKEESDTNADKDTTTVATTTTSTLPTPTPTPITAPSMMDTLRLVAQREYTLAAWCDLLRSQINETRFFTEKKQIKSSQEILAELEALDEEEDVDDISDDVKKSIRENPHNVPLGPDGKPIPYWLFKLHGLNIYYSCEICGDFKYRGERAFYKHFKEWRHTFFLDKLGITNSDHYINITKIDDALKLHEQLQQITTKKKFDADKDEEVEDILGNIYSKADYMDLKMRGEI